MLPVILCLISLGVLLIAEYSGRQRVRVAAKLGASSAFVWAAVSWGALQSPFGELVLLALLLCWLGDALLLSPGHSHWFQLGIAAFLLAHLCYALAFARLALDPATLLVSAALAGVAVWSVARWLLPVLPAGLQWPVLGYFGAISLMVVLAAAAVGSGAPPLLGMGAVGFALSDVSVARDRFVSPGFINAAWGLPLYFVSQLALASCVSLTSSAA